MKKDLYAFVLALIKKIVKVRLETDFPEGSKMAGHYLDIRQGKRKVIIEWRYRQGFGFFNPDVGYGEGPELVIKNVKKAVEYTIKLLNIP